jgi:hypothetical protein
VLTTTDINGGTVDGAVIGGSSAAAITGTTITATGDVTIADKIIHAGDTNTAIRFPLADTVTMETSGIERFRIDALGRVGIGVTNQVLRLQVAAQSSSASTVIAATDTDYTATFRSSQLIYNPVDTTGTLYGVSNSNLGALSFLNCQNVVIGTNGNVPMVFATNSTERMRITGAGNVGIGTTGPTEKLDVSGNINTTLATYNFVQVNSGTVQAQFAANGGGVAQIRTVSDHPMALFTNNLERMRITSAGLVGIGTTAPQRILHIATAEPTVLLQTTSAAVDQNRWRTRVNTSGNFLIGTANDAFNASEEAYQIVRGTGIAVSTHIFSTANTERMRIDASGNVLIGGTATPASATASLAIFNGIAPTGSVTNGVVLYAEDVSSSSELKVRDEAGNVTTLSPHNFDLIPEGPSEDMAWSYYSERDGKRINVDMLKAIRLLESITGEKLVHIV